MTIALITDLVRNLWSGRNTEFMITIGPDEAEILVTLRVFNSATGEWYATRRTKSADVEVALSALHVWLVGVERARIEAVATARAEGEA